VRCAWRQPFTGIRGEMSQEKAAQIAGLDRTDFLLALARERVDAFMVNFEDLKREIDRG
jgi:hypothetical protein